MDLRDSRSKEMFEEEQEGSVEVEEDHGGETPVPAELMEASECGSVEEVEILEDKTEDEGRKEPEDEKNSTKRQYDDLQSESTSPVKRRRINLEIRRKAIEKFEEEMIVFVWDYLSANHAGKFANTESLHEFSIKTVKDKIIQPEVGNYSNVIEEGGSWTGFEVNRAVEENVKRFLDKLMFQ